MMAGRIDLAAVASAVLLVALGACGAEDADRASSDVGGVVEQQVDAFDDLLRSHGLSSIASALDGIDIAGIAGTDEYTFLAPSDEAFRASGTDDLATLLSDPQPLEEMLANHTIAERLDAADLTGRTSVEAVSGATHDISSSGGEITVAGAVLGDTDIDAGVAVVHVIDGMIVP